MTLIDFRYKEFTSIVTAFAVAPTQRGRSIADTCTAGVRCAQNRPWALAVATIMPSSRQPMPRQLRAIPLAIAGSWEQ